MAATKVKRRRRHREAPLIDTKVWVIGGWVGLAIGLLTLVLAALFWDKSVHHGDIAAIGGDVEIPVTLFSVLTFGLGVAGVALGCISAFVATLLGKGLQRWAGAAVLMIVWSCVMWTRHDGRLPYGMTYSSCDGFFHSSNERVKPPAFECRQNARASSAKWRPLMPYPRAFDPKNTEVAFLSPGAAAIVAQQNVRDGEPLVEFALVIQGPDEWHGRKVDRVDVKKVRDGVYGYTYTFGTRNVTFEYDSAAKRLRILGQDAELAENWIAVVKLNDDMSKVETIQRVAAPRFALVGKDRALALVNGARLDRMVTIAPCWPQQWTCEAAPPASTEEPAPKSDGHSPAPAEKRPSATDKAEIFG